MGNGRSRSRRTADPRARRAGIAPVALAGVLAAALVSGCSGDPAPAPTAAGPTAAPTTSAPSSAPATSAPATSGKPAPATSPVLTERPGSPPIPWDTAKATQGAPKPSAIPSARAASARLEITLDDGFGIRSVWTLRCSPAAGNHPEPAKACGVLGANADRAFAPPAKGQACTQQYGGPQKALIKGTWKGRAVNAQFSLEDGCQIGRWSSLIGVLPPGGTV